MTKKDKKAIYDRVMESVSQTVIEMLNETGVSSFKEGDLISKEDAKNILNNLYKNWDSIDDEKKEKLVQYIKTIDSGAYKKISQDSFSNATWMNKLMKIYERAIDEKNKIAELAKKQKRFGWAEKIGNETEDNADYDYDATNIFFLTDSSGSMSEQTIHEIFVKLTTIGLRVHGLKSAMTYFSSGIEPSRVRVWDTSDSRLDILKKIRYESGKDIIGGTDIYKSIAQVTKLGSKYFSKNHPGTIIIVITDGEDGTDFISKLPSAFMNRVAFMIVNDNDSLKRIVNEYRKAGVSDKNILAVDVNSGNTTK